MCLSVILSGCSYSYDFIVANDSGEVLEVDLKWNKELYSSPYKFKFEKISVNAVEKLEAVGGFTKEENDAAEQINTLHVSLEPKQALRIHKVTNRDNKKFDVEVDNTFQINFLSLKGKSGTIELTGSQVWFQFRSIGAGYFIVYK